METIVCFGDSNTWGEKPTKEGRYAWEVRWTGIVQSALSGTARIIEEGLGGRTTAFDDPLSPGRNGLRSLPQVLETHAPIDMLIIMLGTNDVKARFNLTPYTIAQGAAELLETATLFRPQLPRVLLVAPPHIEVTGDYELGNAFEGGREKSMQLARHYEHFARKFGCEFLDSAPYVRSSGLDGVHWDEVGHRDFAAAVLPLIRRGT